MSMRTFRLLLVGCLATGTLWAADDQFTGKWKLNPSKSTLTDVMKVGSVGANKYSFDFGSGNAETILVDGTDQPGIFGTTLAVTAEAPDTWKVVRKKDGRTMVIGIWKLSEDGNQLTDNFTAINPDGSKRNLLYVYKRTGGGSGFAATWESMSEQVNSAYEIQIAPYESDGLSFISPAQQMTKSIKFDGKDYPGEGPNLPAGYASSASRVNAHALQLTDKINGKAIDTQQIELSPDLKTLTISTLPAGRTKPTILVFERE